MTIEEFLIELAKVPAAWEVSTGPVTDGWLVGKTGPDEDPLWVCPVTAVLWHQTKAVLDNSRFAEAGQRLGLSKDDTLHVAVAADTPTYDKGGRLTWAGYIPDLRAKLLAACGLAKDEGRGETPS